MGRSGRTGQKVLGRHRHFDGSIGAGSGRAARLYHDPARPSERCDLHPVDSGTESPPVRFDRSSDRRIDHDRGRGRIGRAPVGLRPMDRCGLSTADGAVEVPPRPAHEVDARSAKRFGAGMAVPFRYPESPHIRIHGQSAMRITTAFGIGCGTNSRSDAFIVSSAKLGHSAVFISIILRRSPSNRIAHWITTICSTAARRAISPNRLRS